jgi:hypothetical protein
MKAGTEKVSLRALIIRYCEEGLKRDKDKKKGG